MRLDPMTQPFSSEVYTSQENIHLCTKPMYPNVHNSSVGNIPKLEAIQMPINRRRDE